MIPAEAVEAAAEAIREAVDPTQASIIGPYAASEIQARAALEAAAPHMLAGAWESGYLMSHYLDRGYDESKAATYPAPDHIVEQINGWNPYETAK